jgi:DUF1009 family protein
MPPGREKDLSLYPPRLGIIAGGGVIPEKLVAFCRENNIEPVVIGLEGQTDRVEPDYWGRIGQATKILLYLRIKKVEHVVMIGAVQRPDILTLWPDWETFWFFVKIWLGSFGDSKLLSAAKAEMEKRGFIVRGVHEFLPELLMPAGALTRYLPPPVTDDDIELGMIAARKLGEADKGQAVIVKNGSIIGREDKSGTSALIRAHGQPGAILVKMCKPQQEKELDLPTIGPETVRLCANRKMAGIVGQADATILADREETIKLAEAANMFVFGMSLDE